jgi:hypothetical protein
MAVFEINVEHTHYNFDESGNVCAHFVAGQEFQMQFRVASYRSSLLNNGAKFWAIKINGRRPAHNITSIPVQVVTNIEFFEK